MAESNLNFVHLDLKGAPPKLSYIEEIFPLFRQWGATGLLLEYEDMFPYQGELSDIASPRAYSQNELRKIHDLAKSNNLEMIPLIQTFGHLEFVLKHESFANMREIPTYPTTLCPSHPESLSTIASMIDQVMAFHPRTRWFHIGCDEVYHLGKCDSCRRHMSDDNLTAQQLFFVHVKAVVMHIKSNYPSVTVIIWDDMFRFAEVHELEESGLRDLVEPMVWHYIPQFILPENLFDNLSVVFPHVWVASAFKGATGVSASMTNISFHIENHMSWLKLIEEKRDKFTTIRGFAVTGWQRYDHYAVLCELLPASLPCLAVCLSVIANKGFTADTHREVSLMLGFEPGLPLNPYQSAVTPQCRYPGSTVYSAMFEWIHLQARCDQFLQSETLFCWMNDANLARGFVNPMHIDPIVAEASNMFSKLCELKPSVKAVLSPIYHNNTVTEWIEVFLDPKIRKMSTIVEKGQQALGLKCSLQTDETMKINLRPEETMKYSLSAAQTMNCSLRSEETMKYSLRPEETMKYSLQSEETMKYG